MKRNIIITIMSLLLLVSGCKKSFLDTVPLSIFTPENLVDMKGMQAALTPCSYILEQEYYSTRWLTTEAICSDLAVYGGVGTDSPADLNTIFLPDNVTNSSTRTVEYWNGWWDMIKYANVVITRMDNATLDSDTDKNAILGQAYFYRSFAYYRLVHQFGDVPLLLEEVTKPRLDFYTFTRESILKKMKEDMLQAVEWLPAVTPQGSPNNAAGYHLLAKICLALCDFDGAIAACNNVINDGTHRLMRKNERFGVLASTDSLKTGFQAYANGGSVALDVIYDLNHPENRSQASNKESIFVLIDRLGIEGNFGGDEGGTEYMRNNIPQWQLKNKIQTPAKKVGMIEGFDEFGQYRTIGRGSGYLRTVAWFNVGMWSDPKDMRHKQPNWWKMTDLIYNNKSTAGSYYGKHVVDWGQNLGTDSSKVWYPFFNKFLIPDPSAEPRGGHSDWYVFRTAETYLLRAEAYFWKDDLVNALADLNAVHERAGCNPLTLANISIDQILDERAKELYYEEPRHTELTRISYIFAKTGKSYKGKTYSISKFSQDNFFYDRVMAKNNWYANNYKNTNGKSYRISPWHVLWPIQATAINANTQGHINQNMGYSGSENNIPPKVYPDDYVPE